MPAITATIITLNEEDRIGEAISSLACCDEVVVVDSGSTDRTREIARGRGARVIQHAWEGYSKQKNFAAEQARNDWILSIDADERLSIELADEIVSWKKQDQANHAFSMPRRVTASINPLLNSNPNSRASGKNALKICNPSPPAIPISATSIDLFFI